MISYVVHVVVIIITNLKSNGKKIKELYER